MLSPVPKEEWGNVEYGLLTPNGEIFKCGFAGHSNLTWDLRKEGVLDEKNQADFHGAQHISGHEFDRLKEATRPCNANSRYYADTKRVTQAQIDAMFDYLCAVGNPFDLDMFEKLEVIN